MPFTYLDVVLGDLEDIMLAIEPTVCRFNPRRGKWIFEGDENP
jgi:hypothetical protein